MKYMATTSIGHPIYTTVSVEARSYFDLCSKMHDSMEKIRYYLHGVNGGINPEEIEPYTKDMVYPKVQWRITREEDED